MSDEGDEDTEEEADEEEASATEESTVVEEGQGSRQFFLCFLVLL